MLELYNDVLRHLAGFLTLDEKLNVLLMVWPAQTSSLQIGWIEAELDCLYLREWTSDLINTDNAKLAFRLMEPKWKGPQCPACQVRDLLCPHRNMKYTYTNERQRKVNRILLDKWSEEDIQWLQLAMQRALTVQVAKKSH